ncbi:tRNA (adenosine(37)-N6)-threonylcarbamoyltransferase complex dimerization subunit type 1 TsaB [Oceanicola sp. S124]|uniref:tRNA (adenosine(37)-N6)-threonylcarbamoyltransferase complex dimerization subunit type 1 TsaB n=1 Tax=Oceanicola sp. S124 TaxID=1042378 RepID=UPI000255828D|nr:tRNA (adenosine(37)-N6)-threonylcarbamoyltransferase complex dimerization subunit type 1 TsaB [Oceanicola sp. S124]
MSLILAFDTSAPHCAAALLDGETLVAERHEPMARGQAERLVPLLEELLTEAGRSWSDLAALAVGVGPGNFTGIRISVALARGLALGLKVPAVGVTGFEALAHGRPRPLLATLPAPREQLYGQVFTEGAAPGEAQLFAAEALSAALPPEGCLLLGAAPGAEPAPQNPAPLIARVAASRLGQPGQQPQAPAPFYLRPADAAPPRDAPPRILP